MSNPRLDRVLKLLWEDTTERIEANHLPAMEGFLINRAAAHEARLVADIRDWEAYPPNACSCPKKKRDWDYRMYSRSCLRGDHQREATVPGQGVD